ncbi:5440_t:CDS:10, partial [Entrophospora sp. SA101]
SPNNNFPTRVEYNIRCLGKSDYQICVFDNRGVGWSGKKLKQNYPIMNDSPSGLYREMACDAIDLLNEIGWTSDVNLVGISMGGMISQELVLLKPHYFKSLCLTSTTSGLTIPPISCIITLMKLFMKKNPIDKVQLAVDALFPEHWLKSPSIGSSHNTNRERVVESMVQRISNTRIQPVRGAIGQISACLRHYVSSERLRIIQDKIPKVIILIIDNNFNRLSDGIKDNNDKVYCEDPPLIIDRMELYFPNLAPSKIVIRIIAVVIYFCSGVIPLDRICSVFATQKSHLKDKDNSIRRKKHQIELAIQKQHDDLVHFSDDRVNHVTNQRSTYKCNNCITSPDAFLQIDPALSHWVCCWRCRKERLSSHHVIRYKEAEDHVTAITFETLKAEEPATLFTSMFDSNDDNKMIPKPIVSAAAIALPETSITGTVTTNG